MNYWQLLQSYSRYIIYGFLHYFFSFVGQTFFISLFVVGICQDRAWETTVFSGIYSGVTLCAAFLLPFIGTQVDRFRLRYISSVAAFTMIMGCLFLAFTHHWIFLTIGILGVRLGGQGVLPLIASTAIGRYFTEVRGKSLSLSMIGISVAEFIIPPLATAFILANGYRDMWLLAAALLLFIFIPLIWILIKSKDSFQKAETLPATVNKDHNTSWTRGQVIRDRRFQLIIPTLLFLPFVFTGFVFNQSEIALSRNYSPALMAIGLSVFGAVKGIMLFTVGSLIDRFGAKRLLIYLLIPILLGLSLFVLFPFKWVVPVMFGLSAISGGAIIVTAPALWAERYGPKFLGSIKSTVRLLVVLSSALAPILFTWGLKWGVNAWLLIIIGYGLFCIFLAWRESKLNG